MLETSKAMCRPPLSFMSTWSTGAPEASSASKAEAPSPMHAKGTAITVAWRSSNGGGTTLLSIGSPGARVALGDVEGVEDDLESDGDVGMHVVADADADWASCGTAQPRSGGNACSQPSQQTFR
mmetsp:Transcript_11546/g.29884  ORF Transcript_11546/g.29884 Transcript_11546/m.29884 type:complete len:124 (+) Transcript_11546:456-827(+)